MEKLDLEERADIIRRRAPLFFTLAVVLVLGFWFSIRRDELDFAPNSGAGLYSGIAALAALLLLSSYKLRKWLLRLPAGSMRSWSMIHVYTGIVATFLVFLHSGFSTGGALSSLLLALFLMVSASGVVGALLYKVIPLSLSRQGKDVISRPVIQAKSEKLLEEADSHMEGASDEFRKVYEARLRPVMAMHRGRWAYLFLEEGEVIQKSRALVESVKALVPAGEVYSLNLLGAVLVEKERLSFRLAKLDSLSAWLHIHVPLTLAMLVAAGFHVMASFYY